MQCIVEKKKNFLLARCARLSYGIKLPPPTAADSFEDSFGGFDVSDVPAGMMAGGGGVGIGGGAGAPMNSFGAAAPQRAPLNASAFAAAPGGASMNPFGRTAAPADPFAGLGGLGK